MPEREQVYSIWWGRNVCDARQRGRDYATRGWPHEG